MSPSCLTSSCGPPTPLSLHMPPSTPGVFLLLRHSKSIPTSAFIPSVPSAWNASPCFLRAEALPSCGHQGLSGPCVLWRSSLTTGILRSVRAGSVSACSAVPRCLEMCLVGRESSVNICGLDGGTDRQQMVSLQQGQEAEAPGSQDLRAQELWGPWGWEVAAEVRERHPAGGCSTLLSGVLVLGTTQGLLCLSSSGELGSSPHGGGYWQGAVKGCVGRCVLALSRQQSTWGSQRQ